MFHMLANMLTMAGQTLGQHVGKLLVKIKGYVTNLYQ